MIELKKEEESRERPHRNKTVDKKKNGKRKIEDKPKCKVLYHYPKATDNRILRKRGVRKQEVDEHKQRRQQDQKKIHKKSVYEKQRQNELKGNHQQQQKNQRANKHDKRVRRQDEKRLYQKQ